MAQNVGTAKVTIEADFSNFQKDMDSFFGKAGKSAGDSLDKGISDGVDKAEKSLDGVADAAEKAAGDAADSFSDVGKAAGDAGADASKQFGSGVDGVSTSAGKAAGAAGKAFGSVPEAAGNAGAQSSQAFSVSVEGVSTSAANAATGASSALSSISGVGSSVGGTISSGFSTAMSSMSSAASNAVSGISSALSEVSSSASYHFGQMRDAAEESMAGIAGKVKGIGGAAVGLLGLAGAGQVMQNAFAKNTAIEDTTAALTVMMGSAEGATRVMDDLAESNQNTPYAFDAWAGAGKTLVAFGMDAEAVSGTVTALGEAASATGKGTEALDSMSTAFGQALASGKISMETINTLAAGGVNGLAILANEAGVSTAEMQKLISQGAVPASEAIETLSKGIMEGTDGIAGNTQALEGTMGAMAQTTSGVLTNLGAAFNNLGSTILDFVFPAIKVLGQGATDLVYWFQGIIQKLQEGEGPWGAIRVAVLGVAGAMTVFLMPALAAVAAAILRTFGGSVLKSAITGAWQFWFAAGGGGQKAGVLRSIWDIAVRWTRAAAAAVIQGARAATAWVLAAPKNLGGLLRNFAVFTGQWIKAAGIAVVQGAKAGTAWVLAAPKNFVAFMRNFPRMIAGWVSASAAALLNAGKIALAWVIAAPKNIAAGTIALGTMAAQWARAGLAALVNGAKIAAGWLLALGPIGLVIGAVAGVIAFFVLLWNKVDGFREFFVGIWDGLVAVVSDAWQRVVDTVMGIWDGLVEWFQGGGAGRVWESIVSGAQTAWDTLVEIWNGAVEFFSGIFDTLAGIVSGAWTAISESFMWFWETVLQPIYTWIAETWGKIWDLIGPVWDQVGSKLAEFGGWFSEFWSGTIWPVLSQIIDWFKRIGEAIGGFISEHWEKFKWVLIILGTVLLTPIIVGLGLVVLAIAAVITIVGVVVGAITAFVYLLMKLPGWIGGVVTAVKDWFADMWQKVKDAFSRAGSAVSDFWNNHVRTLPGKVGNAIGSVIDWFKELPGKIKDAVSGAGRWLLDTGANIIKGLKNGLEDKVKDIGSWFLDKLPGFIRKPFEKVMGINSPSRVFKGYGVNIGEGLIQGLDSMRGDVAEATEGMAGAAKDVDLPELTANATVAPVAMAAPAASPAMPEALAGPLEGPDLSMMVGGAETAETAFTTAATTMQTTSQTVLDPMWNGQQQSMIAWGSQALTQTGTVVNPALASTGLAATNMNLTQWQPAMMGMRTGMTTTALTTQTQANGVMNPAVRSVGATALGVLNGSVNPAMSGMRSAVQNTAESFRTGARNIGVYWNQVREATAQPARFTINRVFNDGIVGMWNSATELLGTKKMNRYHASFARGGTWRGGSTLPGYTPGRDTYRFVEPRSGMSIDMGGGESIMRPEVTKALGTSRIDSLNAAARMGGSRAVKRTLGQFASGGVVPSITNLVKRHYPMMTITSTHRNTADNHGRGLAVDFSNGTDSTPQMRSAAQFFYQNYGKGLLELIHSPFRNNVKNGRNVGDGFGFYGAGTMNQHRNHVHVAAAAPLGAPGSGVIPVVGDGGSVDPGEFIKDMAKPYTDKIKSALAGRQKQGGLVDQWPEATASKMQAAATSKMVKAFEEMGGDPGGAGVERWRPLAKKAMARTGFDWKNPAQVNAMMKQIASESGGNPGIRQQVIDVNSGGNEAMGLLQVIPGTFAAHRDPALPNDRTHPFANMVAALRYYRSRYGGDLTTMWGHGHGYDQGGVITDKGLFSKQTTQAERMLSPRQTASFEELVDFLSGSGWDDFVAATGAGRSSSSSPFGGGVGRTVKVAEVSNHFHGPVGVTESADTISDRIAAKAW